MYYIMRNHSNLYFYKKGDNLDIFVYKTVDCI